MLRLTIILVVSSHYAHVANTILDTNMASQAARRARMICYMFLSIPFFSLQGTAKNLMNLRDKSIKMGDTETALYCHSFSTKVSLYVGHRLSVINDIIKDLLLSMVSYCFLFYS